MKKLAITIILFNAVNYAFSQISERNSLWAKLSAEKNDTAKVNLLNKLGDFLENDINPDSCFLISLQAMKLADSIGYKKGMVQSQVSIAYASQAMGDFGTSVKIGYAILNYA